MDSVVLIRVSIPMVLAILCAALHSGCAASPAAASGAASAAAAAADSQSSMIEVFNETIGKHALVLVDFSNSGK